MATDHCAVTIYADHGGGRHRQRCAPHERHPGLHGNGDSAGRTHTQGSFDYHWPVWVLDHRRRRARLHDSGFHKPELLESTIHGLFACFTFLLGRHEFTCFLSSLLPGSFGAVIRSYMPPCFINYEMSENTGLVWHVQRAALRLFITCDGPRERIPV